MIKYLLIGCLLCALSSCKSTFVEEQIEELEIGPESRIVSGTVEREIYSFDKIDTASFNIQYEYFSKQFSSYVMDSSYKDSVNFYIQKSVLMETGGELDPHIDGNLSRSFFGSRLDTLVKYYNEELYQGSNLWSMDLSLSIDEAGSYVNVTSSGWSYMGGAHGNGYVAYKHFDRETGRELSLMDFFTDIDALNSIAEPHFRKLFDLNPTESLNDYGFWFENDKFSVNNNFTFTSESVVFYYNSYEIAPYSGGPTELEVPLNEIRHLFKLNP
jgi:hypothetical protein